MARFKLTIEYDGTRYAGWQVQKGEKTIQGSFFESCRKLFGETPFEFFGAGRTDGGVHALGQVAHLEVTTKLSPERIRMGLNDNLPYDINVLQVSPAHPKFHARFDAVERSYVYLIAKRRTAFGKNNVWWIKDELDLEAMAKAAGIMKGKKDFASFTDKDAETNSTQVFVTNFDVYGFDEMIGVHITGSHFLWKQVRRMVGVMVDAGRGRIAPSDIEQMFLRHSDVPAKLTAPASGLYLERVYYKGEPTIRGKHVIPDLLRLR